MFIFSKIHHIRNQISTKTSETPINILSSLHEVYLGIKVGGFPSVDDVYHPHSFFQYPPVFIEYYHQDPVFESMYKLEIENKQLEHMKQVGKHGVPVAMTPLLPRGLLATTVPSNPALTLATASH